MGHRNMHQMLDLEIDQGHAHHLTPEPCFLLGNLADFPNHNAPPVFAVPGSTPGLDLRHLPDHRESNIFYGNLYGSFQHPGTNLDLGGSALSNSPYNHCVIPSSSARISPHGSSDHLASSGNHGGIGVCLDEYGRSNTVDNGRGSCKRKNSDGAPGNYLNINGPAGSSSSSSLCGPLGSGVQPREELFQPSIAMMESALPLNPVGYRGNGSLSINEGGSHRSVRSRSSGINIQLDSVLAHQSNQIMQGNYIGPAFHPISNVWIEQFGNNSTDMGSSSWHYGPPLPYLPASSNARPVELASMNGQVFQDPTSSRNSGILLHPLSAAHQHGHHLTPLQGMRVHNYGYNAQVPLPPYRHPPDNFHQGVLSSSRDTGELPGSRYPRNWPSAGDRIYRPQPRMMQITQGELNGHMRLLAPEEVAVLEFSSFYGAGDFIDQHRDMRLDIDNMSYEELLALEERMGDVNTGLSEESIAKCLKTRLHCSRSTSSPSDQPVAMDEGNETCIICQVEYEENEQIGALDCGHDYHAECIRQWLLVKNVCPICKTAAWPSDKK